jgi:hypothetical protein
MGKVTLVSVRALTLCRVNALMFKCFSCHAQNLRIPAWVTRDAGPQPVGGGAFRFPPFVVWFTQYRVGIHLALLRVRSSRSKKEAIITQITSIKKKMGKPRNKCKDCRNIPAILMELALLMPY